MYEYQSAGNGGGGDRTPILKFSAKDGSFVCADRVNIDGAWQTQEREIDAPFKAVFDMAEVEMGWIAFNPAPDFVMVKSGAQRPEKPTDDHKWGFRIRLANKDIGVRELSSSSKNVYTRMIDLFKAYEAGKASNPGKVPVVEVTGTERVVQTLSDGKTQTWRVPAWTLSGWADRPDMLDSATETTPDAPAPTAPAAPAGSVQDDDIFK